MLFTLSFLGGSEVGLGWYKLSVLFDNFGATIGALNVFGLVFCAFLYIKVGPKRLSLSLSLSLTPTLTPTKP